MGQKLYNLSSLIHGPKIHGPCFDSVSFRSPHTGAEKVFHFVVLVSFRSVAFREAGLYVIFVCHLSHMLYLYDRDLNKQRTQKKKGKILLI